MNLKILLVLGIIVTFGAMALNGVVMWKLTTDVLLTASAALIPLIAAAGGVMAVIGDDDGT